MSTKVKLNAQGKCELTIKGRLAFTENGKNHFIPYHLPAPHNTGFKRYGGQLILEDNVAKLISEAMVLLADKHGVNLADLGANQKALRNGNSNTRMVEGVPVPYDGFADKKYVTLVRSCAYLKRGVETEIPAPNVYGIGGIKDLITSESDPRILADGCYAMVKIVLYVPKSKKSISCSYNAICFTADDFEQLGGGTTIKEDDSLFAEVVSVEEQMENDFEETNDVQADI